MNTIVGEPSGRKVEGDEPAPHLQGGLDTRTLPSGEPGSKGSFGWIDPASDLVAGA